MAPETPLEEKPRGAAAKTRVRDAILDAAASVFAEHGEAASMDALADAAGVGRTTLYRYFPSREALLVALAESAVAEAGERIRQARLDAVPIPEAIARLARAFVAIGNRYFLLVREGATVDKQALERECRAPVQKLFQRAQKSAELRDDLPVEWLEKLFIGTLLTGLMLAADERLGDEETAARIVTLFLEGAGGPPSTVAASARTRPR